MKLLGETGTSLAEMPCPRHDLHTLAHRSIDGSGATQVTFERDPGVTVAVPHWSAAGDRVVFVRGHHASLDVCAIHPDGTGFTMLVPEAYTPCSSPDGRWLYFSRPGMDSFKMDLATREIHHVRERHWPSVARDGTLYFTRMVDPIAARSSNEVCRARPEDGPAEALARVPNARVPLAPRLWLHPVLSPDGRWLAAPLLDSTTANLWLFPSGGGEMRPVTDFGERAVFIARAVSWSPDSRLLYAAVADVDADIVVLDGLLG